jgi:hypothetical protein
MTYEQKEYRKYQRYCWKINKRPTTFEVFTEALHADEIEKEIMPPDEYLNLPPVATASIENDEIAIAYVKDTWQICEGGKVPFREVYRHYCEWMYSISKPAVSAVRFSILAKPIIGSARAMNDIRQNEGKNFMGYNIERRTTTKFEGTIE